MAARIRLKRLGAKKDPFFRIVVVDIRVNRDGRFIEELGYYDPTVDEQGIKVDEERALHWLMQGAQPSDTVRSLFRRLGITRRYSEARAGSSGQVEAS